MQPESDGDANAEQPAGPSAPLDLTDEPNGKKEDLKPSDKTYPGSRPQTLSKPEEEMVSHQCSVACFLHYSFA